jgi:hypothetical protein
MKKKLLIFCIAGLLSINIGFSQETFKVMFYNLLNFPLEDNVPNRAQHLNVILSDYQPDLFLVCELNNSSGANTILNVLQNINSDYNMATFELNTSDDNIGNQNDLQNLIFYDSTKFILESQNIVTSIFRDFNHYQLKLNTVDQDINPIILDVIVCHLKASNGTSNAALRYQMTQDLTTYLNTFPSDSNVMHRGDINFNTNSEDGFQEFTDNTNNITFVDPANRIGSWHNNTNYLDVFTQSTRTQSGLGGATGGFDDRFDFILTSENILTNTDLFYVANSYQVFGNNNNSNCWNREINSNNCAGSNFSSTIRNALYNFSDHLPVTIQLQTNETLLSINDFAFQNAIEIIGSNIINDRLNLKVNPNMAFNKTISIYNNLGQVIQTIDIKNSLTISVDTSMLSDGIYYAIISEFSSKPIKFVIAN